jgi:hypothetical protein
VGAVVGAAPPPDPGASREERLAILKGLVAAAKKYHSPSPATEANLGRTWSDDLPRLEREFAAAADRTRLLGAIQKFQNSLHNPHLTYTPPVGEPPGARWSAGFRAGVEWDGDRPRFYVEEVSSPALEAVRAGDQIESYEGASAQELLQREDLESCSNSWRGVALSVAERLGAREGARPGESVSLVLRHRGPGATPFVVKAPWAEVPSSRPPPPAGRVQIDYDEPDCGHLPSRKYGPYKLSDGGINFCVYTSTTPPFDRYPIVRAFSFWFGEGPPDLTSRVLRAEHGSLVRVLGALEGRARGVILDLRDNHGGNNPNWFLDWLAPAPYVGDLVEVRLVQELRDPERLQDAHLGFSGADMETYRAALDGHARPGDEPFVRWRPRVCSTPSCLDDVLKPAHPLTRLPLVLVVGPGCASSCDGVARVMAENHFAPVIGEPTGAAFTSLRLEYKVRAPRTGSDLGIVRFALSREFGGKARRRTEGQPIPLDRTVNRTFEGRDRYDRALVAAAIESLH